MGEPLGGRADPAEGRRAAVGREVLGLVVVTAAAIATLAVVVSGPWRYYVLYEGDSLALPLLLRTDVDPLHWVMTSQIFLFPEIPLHLLSRLLGGSVEGSLLVNAVLNVVVLYALLRSLASLVTPRRPQAVVGAVVATLLLLVLVLTEGRALNNEGALATTFLLTTYYGGVVLSGLACVALVLRALRRRRDGRSIVVPVVLTLVIGALTTLSNPLFVLVVVAPWLASVVLLALARVVPARAAMLLAAPVVGSAVLGYASRGPFERFVAVDASTYLHLERIRFAAGALRLQVQSVASTPAGVLELVLLAVLLLVVPVVVLRSPRRRGKDTDAAAALLTVFPVVAALAMLSGQVVTGSTVTRYLMPVAVFAVLPALVLLARAAPRTPGRGVRRAGAAIVAVASLVVAAVALPSVASASAGTRDSSSERCLTDWIGEREVAGVGSFWTVRPLQLYGDPRLELVQVNFDFSAQLWMSNTDDYERRPFTFVLADHDPDWGELATRALGEPLAVVPCGEFDIYDYEGGPGAAELNRLVGESIDRAKEDRDF